MTKRIRAEYRKMLAFQEPRQPKDRLHSRVVSAKLSSSSVVCSEEGFFVDWANLQRLASHGPTSAATHRKSLESMASALATNGCTSAIISTSAKLSWRI